MFHLVCGVTMSILEFTMTIFSTESGVKIVVVHMLYFTMTIHHQFSVISINALLSRYSGST